MRLRRCAVCDRRFCICAAITARLLAEARKPAPEYLIEPVVEQGLPRGYLDFDGVATVEVWETPDEDEGLAGV